MQNKATVRAAFIAVTTLFFAWGFITSLIDPLVASVKGVFTLTNVQAQLSTFAFFIAYGVVSFPAAALIARLKPVPSILIALAMMVLACLIMLGAANVASYTLVLVGLFVLASGITILQVAANPLAAALGDPKGSHFRLTLSQTFNSFGTFIGPFLGAVLFLKGVEVKEGEVITPVVRAAALAGIDRAYFWICGLLILLLVFFWFSRRTVADAAPHPAPGKGIGGLIGDALASKWALFGVLLGRGDGRPRDRLRPAGEVRGAAAARLLHRDRLRAVPVRVRVRRPQRRVCRAQHRPVQLDHVPGDLHPHARPFLGQRGGDFGPAVHGHRRRRFPTAGGRRHGPKDELRDGIHGAGGVLCLFAVSAGKGAPKREAEALVTH